MQIIMPQLTKVHIDGLVQERRNPSALEMELRLSCTNPWIPLYECLKMALLFGISAIFCKMYIYILYQILHRFEYDA